MTTALPALTPAEWQAIRAAILVIEDIAARRAIKVSLTIEADFEHEESTIVAEMRNAAPHGDGIVDAERIDHGMVGFDRETGALVSWSNG